MNSSDSFRNFDRKQTDWSILTSDVSSMSFDSSGKFCSFSKSYNKVEVWSMGRNSCPMITLKFDYNHAQDYKCTKIFWFYKSTYLGALYTKFDNIDDSIVQVWDILNYKKVFTIRSIILLVKLQ
jgi:WD40 repeat protein